MGELVSSSLSKRRGTISAPQLPPLRAHPRLLCPLPPCLLSSRPWRPSMSRTGCPIRSTSTSSPPSTCTSSREGCFPPHRRILCTRRLEANSTFSTSQALPFPQQKPLPPLYFHFPTIYLPCPPLTFLSPTPPRILPLTYRLPTY